MYAGDLLIQSLTGYSAPFWHATAWVFSFTSPSNVFLGLFFVQTAIIIFGSRFFYRRFFGNNSGWVLFLLMLVLSRSSGAMNTFGLNPFTYFQPCGAALGMTLVMYAAIDGGRWKTGGSIAGSMFLYHPITAIWASMLFILRAIIDHERPFTRGKIAGSLLLLLFGSPCFVPFLQALLSGSARPFDTALWVDLAKMRLNHSFFLSRWMPDRFIQLGLFFAGLFFFRSHPVFKRTLPILIGTVAALATVALGELLSSRALLQLDLLRCTYFLPILFFAFVAWRVGAVDISPGRLRNTLWIFVSLMLMLWPLLERRISFVSGSLFALALAMAAGTFFLRAMRRQSAVVFSGFVLVCAATFSSLYIKSATTGRCFNTIVHDPWYAMQIWVRDNTVPGETVLTPPYIEGFRSWSQHPIYGDYKDGGSHLFSSATIFVWWRRMQELGMTLFMKTTDVPAAYHRNAPGVARKQAIKLVVFDKQYCSLSGTALYENDRFGIIPVSDSLSFTAR